MLSGQGLPRLYKAGSLPSLAKLSDSARHMGALVHSIAAIAGWPPRLVPCAGKVLANSACEGFNTKYKTIQLAESVCREWTRLRGLAQGRVWRVVHIAATELLQQMAVYHTAGQCLVFQTCCYTLPGC